MPRQLKVWSTSQRTLVILNIAAAKHGEPGNLLKAFGRSCHEKVKLESWDKLWALDGFALKTMGVAVKDRRLGQVTINWVLSQPS
jgi:hypothetical protein